MSVRKEDYNTMSPPYSCLHERPSSLTRICRNLCKLIVGIVAGGQVSFGCH